MELENENLDTTPATDSVETGASNQATMAVTDPFVGATLRFESDSLDQHGYTSLWSIAAATMGDDLLLTRTLASRLLGFLCKHQCDLVLTSSADAEYLDQWYDRDPSILNDWTPKSERVDVLAQHAHVPASATLTFLKKKKFNPTSTYSPKRADRVTWFKDHWSIG